MRQRATERPSRARTWTGLSHLRQDPAWLMTALEDERQPRNSGMEFAQPGDTRGRFDGECDDDLERLAGTVGRHTRGVPADGGDSGPPCAEAEISCSSAAAEASITWLTRWNRPDAPPSLAAHPASRTCAKWHRSCRRGGGEGLLELCPRHAFRGAGVIDSAATAGRARPPRRTGTSSSAPIPSVAMSSSRASTRRSSCWSATASVRCSVDRLHGRPGDISTIAGFVEPGEALEDAVLARGARGDRHRGSMRSSTTPPNPGLSRRR